MATAEERSTLVSQFLGLAGRLERLRYQEPSETNLDASTLVRWQNLYGDNVTTVLHNRSVLLDKPATVSADSLVEWIAYARETLTDDPPDGPL